MVVKGRNAFLHCHFLRTFCDVIRKRFIPKNVVMESRNSSHSKGGIMIQKWIIPTVAVLMLVSGLLPAQSQDSIEAENQRYVEAVLKQIAGNENKPAEEVFRNIKTLKGTPAGRLLRVMNFGYSRSLGVSCNHCHVPGEWDRDDKPPKKVTRDMAAMVDKINSELLADIDHLRTKNPVINCTTCHRGQQQPALSLPPR